jgi:hypothetical protein
MHAMQSLESEYKIILTNIFDARTFLRKSKKLITDWFLEHNID